MNLILALTHDEIFRTPLSVRLVRNDEQPSCVFWLRVFSVLTVVQIVPQPSTAVAHSYEPWHNRRMAYGGEQPVTRSTK